MRTRNLQEDRKNRFLACGLWLFGCTCWVVGYLYANVNNVPPQVTNIWRASIMLVLNYTIVNFKHQSIDIPLSDFQERRYSNYAVKFKHVLLQTLHDAQHRLSSASNRRSDSSSTPHLSRDNPEAHRDVSEPGSSSEASNSLQNQYVWCLIRTLALCITTFVFSIAQFYLPLPILHTINCTAPIFAILFDYLLNGNKLDTRQITGVILTTLGILVILAFEKQPSF